MTFWLVTWGCKVVKNNSRIPESILFYCRAASSILHTGGRNAEGAPHKPKPWFWLFPNSHILRLFSLQKCSVFLLRLCHQHEQIWCCLKGPVCKIGWSLVVGQYTANSVCIHWCFLMSCIISHIRASLKQLFHVLCECRNAMMYDMTRITFHIETEMNIVNKQFFSVFYYI